MAGAFSWTKMKEAILAGRTVATSGPFVLWTVAGQHPGAEFPADSRPRRAVLRAWSGPLPGETLTAVQLIRNGEVVRAWDLHAGKLGEWRTTFDIAADEFAWYCVRVLSTDESRASGGRPPSSPEIAVASPVYFLPAGFRRPAATPARVALTVTDATSGDPVAATVQVRDDDTEIARWRLPATGADTLVVPATASLRIAARGYQAAERSLYMDCPEIFAFCRDTGGVWPSFYSSETYQSLRDLLGKLKLGVTLTRQAP
jgi:hypothetical protein